ncbi:MAG: hypothetical protein K2X71_12430, partial [Methylobacterium sp.]|nr:hypothetical protein [Methylobacterium sp.]
GIDNFTGTTAAAMARLRVGPAEAVAWEPNAEPPWHQRDRYYKSKDGGYSRLRDDEVVSNDVPARRLGDEMMGRHFGARGERDAVSGGGGKGSLHITMDGFPAGTRARASMDDLFKDVAITQRRQVDSSIKRGPV